MNMNDTTHETIEKLFFNQVKSQSFSDTCKLVSKIMEDM
jgi:hypothetical protein